MKEKIIQAIEHIEKAMELVDDCAFSEKGKRNYQTYMDIVSSLKSRRNQLQNELHYIEKKQLCEWQRAEQISKWYAENKHHEPEPVYRLGQE